MDTVAHLQSTLSDPRSIGSADAEHEPLTVSIKQGFAPGFRGLRILVLLLRNVLCCFCELGGDGSTVVFSELQS